jgi:glycosyltransferase involved in cell wall biosynthesis
MKTAIVCDWLVTIGGAEKFLNHLLHCFPEADIFALIDFIPANARQLLHHKKVQTTFLQHIPGIKKFYRHFLPLMPFAIEQLDVTNYDLVISSSHAVAKGILTTPEQCHISYVHSPMRYAWDLQHHYLRETGLDKKWHGWLARYFLHKLRLWDVRSAHNVDYFLANSQFIAKRINKTYRRNATVIHPPIESEKFTPGRHKEDFYLTAARLVPYKRIDLIVQTFAQQPEKKLIVIGDGPDFAKIRSFATPNIQLLGYQPDHVLIDHLQRAKAFIFAALEDFGLLPLEAQACGTPVIAYAKGGALETVKVIPNPHPTGVFFPEQTIPSLALALQQFEQYQHCFSQENCLANAARFSPQQFKHDLQQFIAKVYQKTPASAA